MFHEEEAGCDGPALVGVQDEPLHNALAFADNVDHGESYSTRTRVGFIVTLNENMIPSGE